VRQENAKKKAASSENAKKKRLSIETAHKYIACPVHRKTDTAHPFQAVWQ
jgi:hypothetical protein